MCHEPKPRKSDPSALSWFIYALIGVAAFAALVCTPRSAKATEAPAAISVNAADVTHRMDIGPGGQHVALTTVRGPCAAGAIALLADGQMRIMDHGCFQVLRGQVQITWHSGGHDTVPEDRFRETLHTGAAPAATPLPAVNPATVAALHQAQGKDIDTSMVLGQGRRLWVMLLECQHKPGSGVVFRNNGEAIEATGCYQTTEDSVLIEWDDGSAEVIEKATFFKNQQKRGIGGKGSDA